MTSPTEPTEPKPEGAPAADSAAEASAPNVPADAQPTEAYAPVDAQATEAYAPVEQPTAVYPPADAQPTEAYGMAGQPVQGQPAGQPVGAPAPYGAPAYGAPAYAAPVADAPAGSGADRPRGLAWASLGLAIGGVVLVSAAFLPLAWGSLALALVGGLLLLVALVLGIVTLVSKKQGGKGLGIGAIAVSVLGGFLWVAALTVAFVWIGLSMAGSSSTGTDPEVSVSEEAAPDEEETTDEGSEETPTGTYDEAAYLAVVKPGVLALMQEIEPSVTEELVSEFYTDDMLIASGEGLLLAGEAAEEAFVSSTVESSQGTFTEDQAQRFYDLLVGAAEQYLVE
ncbi:MULTISPECIES: hypothetical protein [Microbacterium]|uniref:hypothetical protein n=1 Tax=Microbacterium TaxID=33882 RepID=UPI00146AD790|nr:MULTISPECIES: hypothetical protein [Microbacterium]